MSRLAQTCAEGKFKLKFGSDREYFLVESKSKTFFENLKFRYPLGWRMYQTRQRDISRLLDGSGVCTRETALSYTVAWTARTDAGKM
jgi:hypothetical protein